MSADFDKHEDEAQGQLREREPFLSEEQKKDQRKDEDEDDEKETRGTCCCSVSYWTLLFFCFLNIDVGYLSVCLSISLPLFV